MDNTADMIARIRNALKAKKAEVNIVYSKKNMSILKVMKEEGYIIDFAINVLRQNVQEIAVILKYKYGLPAIRNLKLRSKQQRREYISIADLNLIRNGLGIAILSTSKGMLSDYEARQQNVGGEVICEVF